MFKTAEITFSKRKIDKKQRIMSLSINDIEQLQEAQAFRKYYYYYTS